MKPSRTLTIATIVLAAGSASHIVASMDQPGEPRTGTGGANVSLATGVDDLAILTGASSDDAARFESAKRLILRTDEATTAAVSAALRNASLPAAQREIARAIVALDPGSPRFALALRDAASLCADPDSLREVLRALDRYPARPSIGVAVARLRDPELPSNLRSLLSDALLRWSGCDDCAQAGIQGWIDWWARVESLDETSWQAELAKNFRARSERAASRRDVLSTRVVELYNALYTTTPVERRSEVIVSMLRDDLVRVNRLGLELASRALLNAQRLGDGVSNASLALLSSSDEETRAGAARLLENLGAPNDGRSIVDALEREQSARVAAPLLRLSARQSNGVPISTLLRWLRAQEPAGSAAADAILSLIGSGSLPEDAANDARSTLLGVEPAAFTPSQTRLLATLDDERSRETMRQIAKQSTSVSSRRIAALALAEDAREASFLLDGASKDSAWFEGAARAVALHTPNANAFQSLLLAAPAQGQWIDAAAKALLAIEQPERILALRAVNDPKKRDDLLNAALALLDPERVDEGRELLMTQAETRLDLGDFEGALASVSGATRDLPQASQRAQRVRFFSLVALGRLREALAATPGDPVVYWIDALRRCAALPHARDTLTLVEENFLVSMSLTQRAEFDELKRSIVGANRDAAPSPESGKPPAPGPSPTQVPGG